MKIAIEKILPDAEQPRKHFDEQELDELAGSIREHGLIQPVVVEPAGDGYILVDGERRLRACKMLGLQEIEAMVRPATNGRGTERFLLALTANLQRTDLDVIEEAQAYKRLLDAGWSINKIALKVGKSIARVSGRIKLLELDEEIRALVATGKIPKDERSISALLSIEDSRARLEFARRLAEQKPPVKVVAEAARRFNERLRGETVPVGETPAQRLSYKRAGAPNKTQWNALQQVGRVPPWPLVEIAARDTCERCALRDQASETVCKDCPLVEVLVRLIGKVNHG